jgi:hypothetical protein
MANRLFLRHMLLKTTSILALLLMFLAVSVRAEAWSRSRRSSFNGPRGNIATKNTTTVRARNGYSRSSIMTGPRGNTSTRQAAGSWDPVTKTWSRNAATTGPAGNTVTSNTTATRTANGYNKSTTLTGPQGNTATRQAAGSWDPVTRTWTKDVTITGPAGQTSTVNVTSTPNNY